MTPPASNSDVFELEGAQNPFLRYRDRLDSYAAVRDGDLDDGRFVEIVQGLDDRVKEVGGVGFSVTPVVSGAGLATAAELDIELVIKSEVDNVAGSHKARHLFGSALHLLIAEELGGPRVERLAIASCGNAALAAGVVAAALGRELEVFVPVWADEVVVEMLFTLGARVHPCERRPGEVGDPAYLRCREAIADGAQAFSVQGTDTPTAFDGGRTLGWELDEQLPGIESVYIQVGGGALATAVSRGLPEARLHPVQAEGCAPLRAAWDRLAPGFDFADAANHPDDFMQAWATEPQSVASGILDDVTYDWLPLLEQTHASGGHPIVAAEAIVEEAHRLARSATSIAVSATGSAGLAGLLTEPPQQRETVAVLFTGVER